MRVEEVMTTSVVTCSMNDNLEETAYKMWNGDFGAVPVLNEIGSPLGMITDRDICMAVALMHKPPAEIRVGDVMSGTLVSCSPKHHLKDVLTLMANDKIRRMPVVNETGGLVGVLTLSDIAAHSQTTKKVKSSACTYDDFMGAFRRVAAPHSTVKAILIPETT